MPPAEGLQHSQLSRATYPGAPSYGGVRAPKRVRIARWLKPPIQVISLAVKLSVSAIIYPWWTATLTIHELMVGRDTIKNYIGTISDDINSWDKFAIFS